MFVRYHTEVDLPVADAQRRLEELRRHFGSWADVAYRDGEELRARVGPSHGSLAKEVRLEIGGAEIHRKGVIYPINWSATGAEVLFPKLNADLILSQAGPKATTIGIDGTYEPPLGAIGRVVDRVLLRRVAESTVQAWVDRLAEAVATMDGDVT